MMSDVPNHESMVSPIVLTDEIHASSVTGATNVPYTRNTNNDNHELALFPSYFICPITQQPPVRGVTFDIPEYVVQSRCPQVFEYSAIYRYIAIQGVYHARRYVSHPITRKSVRRDEALLFVHDVDTESQEIINQEHLRIGLSLEDERPLTSADYNLYHEIVANVRNR